MTKDRTAAERQRRYRERKRLMSGEPERIQSSFIFAVRLADNHEFVGLFWADHKSLLFSLVDECTDPYSCEYKVLPALGGIFSTCPGGMRVPNDMVESESVFGPCSDPVFTQSLDGPFLLDADGWLPIQPPLRPMTPAERQRQHRERKKARVAEERAILTAVYELGLIKPGDLQ